jgi:hypothetical protein
MGILSAGDRACFVHEDLLENIAVKMLIEQQRKYVGKRIFDVVAGIIAKSSSRDLQEMPITA